MGTNFILTYDICFLKMYFVKELMRGSPQMQAFEFPAPPIKYGCGLPHHTGIGLNAYENTVPFTESCENIHKIKILK